MKRILSILLCALMVMMIIPMSVFMVSATTETIEDKSLAAGESFTKELDLTTVDKTQPVILTFDVTAANAVSTANGKDAVLKINGTRTLRVTSNGAFHIWDQSTGTYATNSQQWNTPNATKNVVATIDLTAGTINFVYHNRNVTISSVDLTGDTLKFQFGDTDTGAITLANITLEYTEISNDPSYTITYTGDGVTESTDTTTGSVTLLEAPVRDGYTFKGWNDGTNTHEAGATVTVSADTTFTAVWEEVTTPDEPAGDDVLYENDFSSADKVAEGTVVGKSATYSDGKLAFAGQNGNSHWSKTVTLNGTDGTITVSFSMQPNLQSSYPILALNGVTVLSAANGSVVIGESSHTVTNKGYNQSGTIRNVTVTIDFKTGDATVSYSHTIDTSHADNCSGTVNIGTISDSLTVALSPSTPGNSWSADDLKITQVKGNKLDVTTREEYDCFKNDFTTTTGNGLVRPTSVTSVVENGALKVQPSETNQWAGTLDFTFPNDSIVSFKFMVPEIPDDGTPVKLLYSRNGSVYLAQVYYDVETGKNVVGMATGNKMSTTEVTEGEWYTITVVMTANSSTVYCGSTLLGTSGQSFAGRTAGHGLFNFNANANDNSVTYYIDDLSVSTVADDTFIKVTGYQKTLVGADGKYNVRFIAAIGDLFDGQQNVGFEIESVANGKSWDKTTQTVYESITANYGTESVLASSIGGKYVTAIAITGIPSDLGTVELVVKPYVTINGVKIYGSAVTVSVNPVTE